MGDFDALTCSRLAIHVFLNRNQSDFICNCSSHQHQVEANRIMSNKRSSESEVDYRQPFCLLRIWNPINSWILIQRKQEHRGESKDSSDPDSQG
jgi:hypothetical protein